MKYVPARHYYVGRRKQVRLIVVHCTVSPESPTGAEAVARYFATTTRKASAHRTSDNNSTVMSVLDANTAFAAAGANADGLHMELVGYADQSDVEWNDAYSIATITQATGSMHEWAHIHNIPHRWLTVDEVADGKTKGFCTHADVSRAFPDVSTGHYDPGPNFPKARAMAIWFPPPPTTIPPSKDDPMFSYDVANPADPAQLLLVLVSAGKQVRLTGNDLGNKVRGLPTHIGQVGSDESARFEQAWGKIIL